MKVLIATDSFKGSLSSGEANQIIEIAIREAYPNAECIKIPIADGGEGTLEAIEAIPGDKFARKQVAVKDPLGRDVYAEYIFNNDSAIIEMAQASGITLLRDDELNPMKTTSFGLGQLISDALKNGYRKIYIGIGGSATNDCGIGAMSVLGYKFLDKNGNLVKPCGENLGAIAVICDDDAMPEIAGADFVVMCDVTNPLTGKKGATYTFGPQKGADGHMLQHLEEGMISFKNVLKDYTMTSGKSYDCNETGYGAAGGLGAALNIFLNAKIQSGIDTIMELADFDGQLNGVDLVITGEGRTDGQSADGKVINGIATRCKNRNIPLLVVSGMVTPDADCLHNMGVSHMESCMKSGESLEHAMRYAKENLHEATVRGLRAIGMVHAD
ncbi:MAG: glycerate kinase [Pseudobutyrivibrio sp.]|nr:glycerate kinase [Pseudobutyrivibrio sp.]